MNILRTMEKIPFSNLETDIKEVGDVSSRTEMLIKAEKYFTRNGISIQRLDSICIIIDDSIRDSDFVAPTPFQIRLSTNTLIDWYRNASDLGSGFELLLLAISTVVDEYANSGIYRKLYDYLNNEDSENVWGLMTQYIISMLKVSGVREHQLSRNPLKNGVIIRKWIKLFGGSRATYAFNALKQIVRETIEATYLSLQNDSKIACDVNKCLTCKYCRVDSDGHRMCKYYHPVKEMSTSDVGKFYDSFAKGTDGSMISKELPFAIKECDEYTCRVK